ncbi:hypothetical protein, partial [Kitasatospora sp. A2-31]|nr:hypothetical protein [Kitasatospora sp. A2-31]
VFAGQKGVQLPGDIDVRHHELPPWESKDTSRYLASRGLPREDRENVAKASAGIPGWAAALTDLLLTSPRPLSRDELEESTPENIWTNLLDTHVPVLLRIAIHAASIPRTVENHELFRALLKAAAESEEGEEVSDAELARTAAAVRALSFAQPTLSADGTPGTGFRVHDMIRGSVLRHLRPQPAWAALHRAAVRYYARTGSFEEETYHRFALGDFSCAEAWREQLDFAYCNGRLDAAMWLTDAVLAPEQRGELRRRNPGLLQTGYQYAADVARIQGRIDDAERYGRNAQAMARLHADPRGLGISLLEQATRTMRHGRLTEAGGLLEDADEALERANDTQGKVILLRRQGEVSLARGDLKAAGAAFEECRRLADGGLGLAYALHGLGALALTSGDLSAAARWLSAARRMFEDSGNLYGRCLGERVQGELAGLRGEYHRADRCLNNALAMYPGTDVLGQAETLRAHAELHLRYEEWAAARHKCEQALSRYRHKGLPLGIADTLRLRACLDLADGRPQEAVLHLDECRDVYTDVGSELGLARTRVVQGRTALAAGQPEEARRLLAEAHDQVVAMGAARDGCLALRWWAAAERQVGRAPEALRLLKQAL